MSRCDEDIDLSCRECYRIYRTDCNSFLIPSGLTASQSVYLIIQDSNGVQFTDQTTIDPGGNIIFSPNNFGKVISKYGGEYTLIVSASSTPTPLDLSISSLTYKCVLLNFENGVKFCGCDQEPIDYIYNGDFATGDLSGWTRFASPGGSVSRITYDQGWISISGEGGVHGYSYYPTFIGLPDKLQSGASYRLEFDYDCIIINPGNVFDFNLILGSPPLGSEIVYVKTFDTTETGHLVIDFVCPTDDADLIFVYSVVALSSDKINLDNITLISI